MPELEICLDALGAGVEDVTDSTTYQLELRSWLPNSQFCFEDLLGERYDDLSNRKSRKDLTISLDSCDLPQYQ